MLDNVAAAAMMMMMMMMMMTMKMLLSLQIAIGQWIGLYFRTRAYGAVITATRQTPLPTVRQNASTTSTVMDSTLIQRIQIHSSARYTDLGPSPGTREELLALFTTTSSGAAVVSCLSFCFAGIFFKSRNVIYSYFCVSKYCFSNAKNTVFLPARRTA